MLSLRGAGHYAVIARSGALCCHCEERGTLLSLRGAGHSAVMARSGALCCHCEERSDVAISSQQSGWNFCIFNNAVCCMLYQEMHFVPDS